MKKTPTNHNLNIVSLFAGIGGFELAFRKTNAKTILMCEIEKCAKHVLQKRLPNTPIIDDVRDIAEVPSSTDLLCAGFPCQDLSSVGVKQGLSGTRSSLVLEVLRILEKRQTEWVIFENVPFMLHLKGGETMRVITQGLSHLGYRWAYRTIDSIAFVPQHRCRVFIVASLHHDPCNVILSGEAQHSYGDVDFLQQTSSIGFYWTEGRYALGLTGNAVPTLKAGSTIGIPSPPAIMFSSGEISTPDIRDAERLQGFPQDWTKPVEEIDRASMRWRLVGNAVTVNTVSWIASKIKSPVQYDTENDMLLTSAKTWPKAAWGYKDKCYESKVSIFPASYRRSSLEQYLKFPRHPLSLKASKGFLNRLQAGGLKTPSYFIDQLQKHIEKMERNHE